MLIRHLKGNSGNPCWPMTPRTCGNASHIWKFELVFPWHVRVGEQIRCRHCSRRRAHVTNNYIFVPSGDRPFCAPQAHKGRDSMRRFFLTKYSLSLRALMVATRIYRLRAPEWELRALSRRRHKETWLRIRCSVFANSHCRYLCQGRPCPSSERVQWHGLFWAAPTAESLANLIKR